MVLVTYEIAKKLKEKGFPQHLTEEFYADGEGMWIEDFGTLEPDFKAGELISNFYGLPTDGEEVAAPTLAQVIDWFIIEKEIFVNIDCSCHDTFDFFYTIYKKGEISWETVGFNDEWYKTKNAAELAGIEHVLNKLL